MLVLKLLRLKPKNRKKIKKILITSKNKNDKHRTRGSALDW
jgi:hypothetical protein